MSAQRAEQLVEAGRALETSGDRDGARRLYTEALRLVPDHVRATSLLRALDGEPERSGAAQTATHRVNLFEMDWASATGFDGPVEEPTPAGAPPPAGPPPQGTFDLSPPDDDADLSWDEVSEGTQPPVAAAAPSPPTEPEHPVRFDPLPDAEISFDEPLGPPADEPLAAAPKLAPDARSAWDSTSNPGVHVTETAPGLAMDFVAEVPPTLPAEPNTSVREEVAALLQGARDLLELDDHTGAIDLVLKAEALAPADPDVAALKAHSEQTLQQMFESKLGSLARRPRVKLKDDEIIWLNLDHRAGFVLAQIDGTVSFDDLFEVCGMSRLDTARILAQLIDEGVIGAG